MEFGKLYSQVYPGPERQTPHVLSLVSNPFVLYISLEGYVMANKPETGLVERGWGWGDGGWGVCGGQHIHGGRQSNIGKRKVQSGDTGLFRHGVGVGNKEVRLTHVKGT